MIRNAITALLVCLFAMSAQASSLELAAEALEAAVNELEARNNAAEAAEGVEIRNINGEPYLLIDLFSEVGDSVSEAEWMDASDSGMIMKTVALPVNGLAKVWGFVSGVSKGAWNYGKGKPIRTIVSGVAAVDYIEDQELDLFGAFDSGSDGGSSSSTPDRRLDNGEVHVLAGDGSSVKVAGDVAKKGTFVVGDNSSLVITDHSGVEERD